MRHFDEQLIGGWALLPVAPYPESLRDGSDSPAFAGLAVPPSVFYDEHPVEARTLLRFAFCKEKATLEEAARRLRRLLS